MKEHMYDFIYLLLSWGCDSFVCPIEGSQQKDYKYDILLLSAPLLFKIFFPPTIVSNLLELDQLKVLFSFHIKDIH